ncbi:hypothetical protein SEA_PAULODIABOLI_344 [Microbacterium phage PauloDiaboli]|nr:hypothetical protein SEA_PAULODIABOLI_344 [Microbacterium phage PauloDiaboli]
MTENESEFGHKDWPTVPGERTLEIIRELIAEAVAAERKRIAEGPVYLLERRSVYADDHGRFSWETQDDRGFWLDREDAEKVLEEVNDNGYGDEWDILEVDPGHVTEPENA